jgi:hypothetical protein
MQFVRDTLHKSLCITLIGIMFRHQLRAKRLKGSSPDIGTRRRDFVFAGVYLSDVH